MLSEEKINLNYISFIKKMLKYGVYTQKMEEDVEFNNLLKNASAFTNESSGGAYDGSLIEFITKISLYSFNLNNLLPENIKVDVSSLIRVCYLHQISKALMYKKNSVDWEIKKGKVYTFNDNLPAIKTGEYSIYLCAKYGIELSIDEYETILSIDKNDDTQTNYFGNSMSHILKSAIDLAILEKKETHKLSLKQ